MADIITNPNGANGTTSDPREQLMWDIYVTNLKNGIDNAKKAAIEVGYSEPHADNITLQGWFKGRKDKLRRTDMLSKAERNLDKVLDFEMVDGEGKINTSVASLVTNVSTTVVKSLGKEVYSERQEHTGANGESLVIQFANEFKKPE